MSALNTENSPPGRFGKGRLEAFSDGVIAIIITIMVLELKVPHGEDPLSLLALAPVFLGYVLSFVLVAIYWNNHHHLFQAADHVTAGVMWANIHLLFWLSLVPFAAGYMTENHYSNTTVVVYGTVLTFCGIAYSLIVMALKRSHPAESTIHRAIGSDTKGKLSVAIDLIGIAIAWFFPMGGIAAFVLVAIIWLIPDRRVERALGA